MTWTTVLRTIRSRGTPGRNPCPELEPRGAPALAGAPFLQDIHGRSHGRWRKTFQEHRLPEILERGIFRNVLEQLSHLVLGSHHHSSLHATSVMPSEKGEKALDR